MQRKKSTERRTSKKEGEGKERKKRSTVLKTERKKERDGNVFCFFRVQKGEKREKKQELM